MSTRSLIWVIVVLEGYNFYTWIKDLHETYVGLNFFHSKLYIMGVMFVSHYLLVVLVLFYFSKGVGFLSTKEEFKFNGRKLLNAIAIIYGVLALVFRGSIAYNHAFILFFQESDFVVSALDQFILEIMIEFIFSTIYFFTSIWIIISSFKVNKRLSLHMEWIKSDQQFDQFGTAIEGSNYE